MSKKDRLEILGIVSVHILDLLNHVECTLGQMDITEIENPQDFHNHVERTISTLRHMHDLIEGDHDDFSF